MQIIAEELADYTIRKAESFSKLTIKTYSNKKGVCQIPNEIIDRIFLTLESGGIVTVLNIIAKYTEMLYKNGMLVDKDKVQLLEQLKKFDKRKPNQYLLFSYANKIYKQKQKSTNSYSYKLSLHDANEQYRIIDKKEFDKDFQNINRNYTNWRNSDR
jgi:hypothetical protein